MFGTLHYDRGSKHSEFIDRTQGFLGDAAAERAACDTCRAKKLKCSGQRAGCNRCKALAMACVYSAVAGGAESRRRKRAASHQHQHDGEEQQHQQHQQQHQQHQQHQHQHQDEAELQEQQPQQPQPPPPPPPHAIAAGGDAAALSPGDALFRFPPTPSESLDLLFGDDFLPDLLLGSPPALSSPAASTSTPCGCLATVVELLEELDALGRPTLDVALASHKLFLNRALRVLHCSGCRARSEHMVLLTRVCDQLALLCERIVLSYLQLDSSAPKPRSSPTLASSPPDFPCPPLDSLFLGCYETDASEWDSLFRVVLSLQLRSLASLLAGVRRAASLQQQPRLQAAETKVRCLVDELQRRTRSLGKLAA